MFGGSYRSRRVLVTGHTGFKGSWLVEWLKLLGAEVAGYSLAPNTTPSHFEILGQEDRVRHVVGDVGDPDSLAALVRDFQPTLVFHLAAQPLVRRSYREPAYTWSTNVMGTVNLLEAIRASPTAKACVVVTSDKCYENHEWPWGYRETDPMGGHDPYSASKGAAELVVSSYRRSFLSDPEGCRLASARAGNVIGGGDWSSDRIVTDFVNSILRNQALRLRNPAATRPWQHVLEPLSGYLALGASLLGSEGESFAEGWNFGPSDDSVVPVQDLARKLVDYWGRGSIELDGSGANPHEAGLLKLDCSKARHRLAWQPVWGIDRTIEKVVDWYREHSEGGDVRKLTVAQIDEFCHDARRIGLAWAGV